VIIAAGARESAAGPGKRTVNHQLTVRHEATYG